MEIPHAGPIGCGPARGKAPAAGLISRQAWRLGYEKPLRGRMLLFKESENVLLLLSIIVAVLVGLVAWCWFDAPNARSLPPHRRQKDLWG
jgi:hypothetical protein